MTNVESDTSRMFEIGTKCSSDRLEKTQNCDDYSQYSVNASDLGPSANMNKYQNESG